jgi:preprotein translocase SecF subunit
MTGETIADARVQMFDQLEGPTVHLTLNADGIAAAVALAHDVAITIGGLLLFDYEFDLSVVAALLTIIGFSVNDTVIVFDRIRENQRKMRRHSLDAIANVSINETLSRTIITNGTAIYSPSWRCSCSGAA